MWSEIRERETRKRWERDKEIKMWWEKKKRERKWMSKDIENTIKYRKWVQTTTFDGSKWWLHRKIHFKLSIQKERYRLLVFAKKGRLERKITRSGSGCFPRERERVILFPITKRTSSRSDGEGDNLSLGSKSVKVNHHRQDWSCFVWSLFQHLRQPLPLQMRQQPKKQQQQQMQRQQMKLQQHDVHVPLRDE